MENKFRLACIQLRVGEDKTENLRRAVEFISIAAKNGAHVVALPESFNSPCCMEDFPKNCEQIPDGVTTSVLSKACKENNVYLVGGSIPEKDGDRIYNACMVFNNQGVLIAKHRKMHLWDIDSPYFMESETVTAGDTLTVVDTPYCKMGIAICHDIRFPEMAMLYQKAGCEIILYPCAFNMPTGKADWELLMRSRAVDNQLYVAGINIAHDPNGKYISWGHSMVTNPFGEILSKTEFDEDIIYADIDLNKLKEIRRNIPYLSQKRNDLYFIEYKK